MTGGGHTSPPRAGEDFNSRGAEQPRLLRSGPQNARLPCHSNGTFGLWPEWLPLVTV